MYFYLSLKDLTNRNIEAETWKYCLWSVKDQICQKIFQRDHSGKSASRQDCRAAKRKLEIMGQFQTQAPNTCEVSAAKIIQSAWEYRTSFNKCSVYCFDPNVSLAVLQYLFILVSIGNNTFKNNFILLIILDS